VTGCLAVRPLMKRECVWALLMDPFTWCVVRAR
jgi:hypothetical protein